jgi:hypothetical protein
MGCLLLPEPARVQCRVRAVITRTRAQRILRTCHPVGTTVTLPTGRHDETFCLRRTGTVGNTRVFEAWWSSRESGSSTPAIPMLAPDVTSLLMRVITTRQAEHVPIATRSTEHDDADVCTGGAHRVP